MSRKKGMSEAVGDAKMGGQNFGILESTANPTSYNLRSGPRPASAVRGRDKVK